MKHHPFFDNNVNIDSTYIYTSIKKNRSYLMGIAMLFVLIYHFICWTGNWIGPLNRGYVGVDIFLFLSGFGLASSYTKNNLSTFYKNRIKRIYPIYFLAVSIAYCILYKEWKSSDYFWNLTTLGYYLNNGEMRFDWYLESLFSLYLLFPFLFFYSRTKYLGLFVIMSVIAFVLHHFEVAWWYDCLIARIPIFIYGIMFHKCYHSCGIISILGLCLYFPLYFYSSRFLASSVLAMPIIILSLWVLPLFSLKGKRFIEFMGKYSLEIYSANVITYKFIYVTNPNLIIKIMIIFVFQILFTILFIYIGKHLKKILY